MTENKPKTNRSLPRPARLAVGTLCFFAAFYTLLIFAQMFCLPERSPWKTLWILVGLAAGAAAVLLAAVELLWALRDGASRPGVRSLFAALRSPGVILALGWCVWAAAACLIAVAEGRTSIRFNSSYLFDLGVSLAILFPLGTLLGRARRFSLLDTIVDAASLLYAALMLFTFSVLLRGEESVMALFGRVFGLSRGRLVLGVNANYIGEHCVFFLFAGIYRLSTVKKPWAKGLYALYCLALAYVLYACGSRASLVAALGGLALFALLVILRRSSSSGHGILRITLYIVGLIALAAVLLLVFGNTDAFLKHLGPVLEKLFRSQRGHNAGTLSSRALIWTKTTAWIYADRHLLLHGCSPASVTAELQKIGFTRAYSHTHDQFLQILLGQGLPALVLFAAWLVAVGKRGIDLLTARKSADDRGWMLPLILIALLIDNIMESMLVCHQIFVGSMFFLTAGYVNGLAAGESVELGLGRLLPADRRAIGEIRSFLLRRGGALLSFAILPAMMLAAALALDGALVALGPDARLYLSVADNFLSTGHFIQTTREAFSYVVPFGMPLILTAFRALRLGVGAIIAIQYVLFGLSCCYLSRAEKNLSGTGILAPGLYAILLIRTDCLLNNIFVEHYYIPCLCAVLLLLTERDMPLSRRLPRLNVAGFIAFAIRPALIVFYLPILVYTLCAAAKKRVGVAAAVLAVALPCLIMTGNAAVNHRETGYWITTENYSGGDLYIANNPRAKTIFYRARDLDEHVDEAYHTVMDDPSLDPTQKSERLGAMARRWMLENPGQFVKNCAERFTSLFIAYWRGLLALAFLGGIALAAGSKRWRALSLACIALALLLSILTSMGLIVGRYSIPVLPLAALQLSALAHRVLRRLIKKKKAA